MAENIQDAESTIRDTDVADEMMKYVKNNILVQSAQLAAEEAAFLKVTRPFQLPSTLPDRPARSFLV